MELFSNVNYLRIRTQGKTASFVSVLSFQSCPILQHHGLEPTRLLRPWVLQTRTLEWVAMPSCRPSSPPRDQTHISRVSCVPLPRDLPDPGIKPASLMSPALAGESFTTTPAGKPRSMDSTLFLIPTPCFCPQLFGSGRRVFMVF